MEYLVVSTMSFEILGHTDSKSIAYALKQQFSNQDAIEVYRIDRSSIPYERNVQYDRKQFNLYDDDFGA